MGASFPASERLKLLEQPDPPSVARTAADRIAQRLTAAAAQRGGATLALSGGNTPKATYALLSQSKGVDWSRVQVFWVDERAVPPDSDRSNYRMARETLLDPAHLPADRVHRMHAESPDLEQAAARYEGLIRQHVPSDGQGGVPIFDVVVLGIGDDGHTASLFPGDGAVRVMDRLVLPVPARGGLEPRLTLTVPVIQSARSVLVLVEGADKHAALCRAWSETGDLTDTPARIIRSCRGEVVVVADSAALVSR
jgi:6-phosphogluconolactonase